MQTEKQLDNISIDDSVLVRQCQNGDTASMQHLIVKYQDRIYNVILKICTNKDDAAELTQETFVKLIEKIGSFRSESSFYTWLFRIAVNTALNFCKRRFKVPMQSIDSLITSEQSGRSLLAGYLANEREMDPVTAAHNKDVCEIIDRSLGKLEASQRAVIVLRDIEGMAYSDIAESLEVELGTVKSRLSRGRENLRQILKQESSIGNS